MEKEEVTKPKKKANYWWILVVLVIIIGYIYIKNIPTNDTTFVVKGGEHWLSCWNEDTTLTIDYDLTSNSAVDLIFTPTREDANVLNETSKHYEVCYVPNVLNNKASCTISGKGCLVLFNKNTNDATVSLKYSAKKNEN